MKKLIGTMLACVMILSLAGCGNSRSDTGLTAETDTAQVTSAENDVTGKDPTQTGEPTQSDEDSADVETTGVVGVGESDGSNILVLYFSRTGEQYAVGVIDKGNTAIVAEMIADRTGGALFEVLPKEDYYPYTYDELTDIAKQEQNDNARPEYKDDLPDLSGYDTVFIGKRVIIGTSQGKAA